MEGIDIEVLREFKKESQDRRAGNRVNGRLILAEKGIAFTVHNGGAHLIVKGTGGEVIDFWPGTGKWTTRKGKQGRGVFRLVDYINGKK